MITAKSNRMAIIIFFRFGEGDGFLNCCFKKAFSGDTVGFALSAGAVRKKPGGGGISGGLSSGLGRRATDCGATVLSLKRSPGAGSLPASVFDAKSSGLCSGCRGAESGGMVKKTSSCFSDSSVISAPQWGQKRYFKFTSSGSCRLHFGQDFCISLFYGRVEFNPTKVPPFFWQSTRIKVAKRSPVLPGILVLAITVGKPTACIRTRGDPSWARLLRRSTVSITD